jgi:rubrerythrin
MNIYDFAMQMEQDGESFYRDMAAQTADVGVQSILNALADDEVKHYNIVKQMRNESAAPMMDDTAVLATAQNVFAQMKGQTLDIGRFVRSGPQVDVYRQAQELERQSRAFYQEKAAEVSQEAHRTLLLRMAEEENKHFFLLDHMIEFVNRPQTWIEDAEFNHLEEY